MGNMRSALQKAQYTENFKLFHYENFMVFY
jgi:hypothetical protein